MYKMNCIMKYISKLLALFAIGMMATACTDDINEVNVPLTVSSPTVSAVSANSAYLQATAEGTHITTRGFCYGTQADPTVDGQKVISVSKNMAVTISSLQAGTTYHVRAYAQTNTTVVYSNDVTFTTATENTSSALDEWKAPTYADDYRAVSIWNMREHWNLGNVHDPSVVKAADGYYYMYCTDAGFGDPQAGHGHFHGRRSLDLVNWEYVGASMPETPSWVLEKANSYRAEMGLDPITDPQYLYWAPCVRKVNDNLYRMYYCIGLDNYIKTGLPNTTANNDGSWTERFFIGVMETADPAANNWVDQGMVLCSSSDKGIDNYANKGDWNAYFYFNAIDPSFIITPEGQHWLIYGSWHSGFAAVQLNPETGKTITELGKPWASSPEELAANGYGKRVWTRDAASRWQASEAPEVIYHDGYYYLFVAYDELGTTVRNKITYQAPYNTRVLRSATVDGTYTGAETVMTHPYRFVTPNPDATKDEDKLDDKNKGWAGISHCAIFDDGAGNYYYVSQQRFPTTAGGSNPDALMLGGVRSVKWLSTGWPTVMPERYAAVPQVAITKEDIVGKWENIDLVYDYGKMDSSIEITFNADGTITGPDGDMGSWTFDAASNTLTALGGEFKVQRECDWEAIPRKHTIVYSGGSEYWTRWGKKK